MMTVPATHANEHTVKWDWAKALTDPACDLTNHDYLAAIERLRDIQAEYRRQVRMAATWSRLYSEQREAFLADLEAFRSRRRAELEGLPKRELAVIHYRDQADEFENVWKGSTRASLIDAILWREDDVIEDEHSRVKKAWAGMTQAEREGQPA